MKIHTKFLFGLIASVLCLCDAKANQCPGGCFCLNGGQTDLDTPQPDWELCKKEHPEPNPGSEMYKCLYGTYGFKDGEFVYESGTSDYSDKDGVYHSDKYDKVFMCPKSYPESANGSKALTDCYKYDERGNKVYYSYPNYGNCNVNAIKATVENLQQALIKAAQDLQEALNKSNQKNNTTSTSSSNADIDMMKAMINAGISDTRAELKSKLIKNVRK